MFDEIAVFTNFLQMQQTLTVCVFLTTNFQSHKNYSFLNEHKKIQEYKGLNKSQKKLDENAKKYADDYLKGKDALHNPDGVAGGKADAITGLGNSRVNSSIGSQWGHGRAASIENQIKQAYGIPPKTINDIPATDMMNVKLL